jgi:hypothetical protein
MRIDGVQANVHVLGLGPATTPPGQVVHWNSAQIGALRVREGTLAFRALEGFAVRVESASWAVDDQGSMSVRPFELDPEHLEIDTTLTLDAVPLAAWLDLVGRDRVSGTGRISGDLAARVVFAPLDVDLGEGHLWAVGGGTVRFLDDPETRKLLEQHVAAGAAATDDAAGDYQDVVKQRIVDSLADFAYEQLTFDLLAQDGHLTLRTHAVGKGRTVPQELDLELNLNGFDELVETALDVKLGVDNAKRRLAGVLAPPELERRSQ